MKPAVSPFAPSRLFLAVVVWLFPAPAFAQPPTARFTADRKDVRLSEWVRGTLTVEGTAPLRVELPKQLLDPITNPDWRIRSLGNPTVTRLDDNRERWTQTFRLDPYVPGESLPVIFAAVKVNGVEVLPGGFEVKVITTVPDALPEKAKPVTGIEELPPPPRDNRESPSPWPWVAATLVLAVVIVMLGRARRRLPVVSPLEWATAEFDRLESERFPVAVKVEGAAATLREFIERRFGIPAPRLTTAELSATSPPWTVEQADSLRALLDRCDRVKFAGDVPDDSGCRDLLARCREWLHQVSPSVTGPG
jgi:hypothetical protein